MGKQTRKPGFLSPSTDLKRTPIGEAVKLHRQQQMYMQGQVLFISTHC